jgi:DNA-binding CsgD family transcriptional regulator
VDGVWVVSSDALLAAAIAAGLSVLGWPVVRLVNEAGLVAAGLAGARVTRLILVANAAGYLPDPRAALVHLPAPLVVAVGARLAWPALLAAVERLVAVVVVDADQPFGDLLRSLDRVLGGAAGPEPDGRLAAALREREREAGRFAALTPREQWTLGQLIDGLSAAEIAANEQVALATVRSHIRSVLAKLGVSSQVAAVALAHRSARELPVVEYIRKVHQF